MSFWGDGDVGDGRERLRPPTRKGLTMGKGMALKPKSGYKIIKCSSRARKVWCGHEGVEGGSTLSGQTRGITIYLVTSSPANHDAAALQPPTTATTGAQKGVESR